MDPLYTSDPFARLLVFYYYVKRTKLNDEDLGKIFKKYSTKPEAMMADLQKKYADVYHFPSRVLVADIFRIQCCKRFTLPACLVDLIQQAVVKDSVVDSNLSSYDPKLDIRASAFDAAVALHPDRVGSLVPCAVLPGVTVSSLRDNINKAKSLLAGSTNVVVNSNNLNKKTASLREKTRSQNTEDVKDVDIKPLDRISFASSKHKVAKDTYDDDEGNNMGTKHGKFSLEDSPLALIYSAMQKKRRIRVVIRRVNSIRGTVDGFVRGFDKHFNLLLTDVDERYSANIFPLHKSDAAMTQDEVLVRHLPQLLIRGDNIVLVTFREKSKSAN